MSTTQKEPPENTVKAENSEIRGLSLVQLILLGFSFFLGLAVVMGIDRLFG